jgi:hypothetical protein
MSMLTALNKALIGLKVLKQQLLNMADFCHFWEVVQSAPSHNI